LRSAGIWLPVTITAAAPACIAASASASAGVGTAPQSTHASPSARAVSSTQRARSGEDGRRSRPTQRPLPIGQAAMKARR